MASDLRELALFAGAGGGLLASRLLGWTTVCAVEIDDYCQRVLRQRQADGHLESFPIHGDIRRFSGKEWAGKCDVVSGGFPCQDISSAGTRRGLDGERSGLWREYARIVGECRPSWVFIENSPHLRTRGLVRVLKELAELGYDAAWGVYSAADVGAPHIRKRMWIVAHLCGSGLEERQGERGNAGQKLATTQRGVPSGATHADDEGERDERVNAEVASASPHAGPVGENPTNANGESLHVPTRRGRGTQGEEAAERRHPHWWPVDIIQGVDDGMANRVVRVRATGNGQVPAVAALAWRALRSELERERDGE